MDGAIALQLYEQEIARIDSALESFFAYVDLIDVDDDEELIEFGEATESKKKKEKQELAAKQTEAMKAAANVKGDGNSKDEKKKGGIGAWIESVFKAIGEFFKRLFGIKDKNGNATLPESIDVNWPTAADPPSKIVEQLNAGYQQILSAISRNEDPARIREMIQKYSAQTEKLLADIDQSVKELKKTGVRSERGHKVCALRRLFGSLSHQKQKIYSNSLEQAKNEKDLISVYQSRITKIGKLINDCRVSGKDTSSILDEANEITAGKGISGKFGNRKVQRAAKNLTKEEAAVNEARRTLSERRQSKAKKEEE